MDAKFFDSLTREKSGSNTRERFQLVKIFERVFLKQSLLVSGSGSNMLFVRIRSKCELDEINGIEAHHSDANSEVSHRSIAKTLLSLFNFTLKVIAFNR